MTAPIADLDAVPGPLKSRPQWLHWDAANDTPRRPHKSGDFGVAWSDPGEWLEFDEAARTAAERGSWGIGYVTAVNNDAEQMGMVSVIDLDDAADEDDELADWVPSLEPLVERGCYIEWSPSHGEDGPSGLHIPVVGTSIPEWWSDSHIDGGHAGADLLANKFCTVTGDKYDGAGDELAKYDEWLLDWLADLYEELNGERPDRVQSTTPEPFDDHDGPGREYDEEWLDEERAEKALDHIDPSCSYEKWRNIGFALADHFDSHTAKTLFENWSRGSSKYDDEAERLIEDIANRGDGPVQIGTLVHHAKEAGWNPSAGGEKVREVEEPADEEGEGTSVNTSWDYVRTLFEDSDVDNKRARRYAAIALTERHEYLYVDTDDRLLKYHAPDGVFEPGGKRHVKKVLARELGMQFSTHDRNEVLATVQDLSAVDVKTLNAEEFDEKLLCLKNGVLDLETRELKDHDPKYRFTQALPVEYNPDATAPEVESFLDEVTQAEDEKETLVEMVGASLHPEYLKSKFLFLFGEGSNGKGVYFDLINHLLGAENVEGRGLHELATNRFAKADLHGKLANIGGDIDDRKLKNVGTIKRLTSNTDPITAERKFGQPFKFVNSATLFFAANEPPAIDDMKRSMGRRLVPIHMATEFVDDPDPEDPFQKEAVDKEDLLADMTTDEELSGLLNMALDGMDRLRNTGDVSLELSPMERLEFYQRFSDPIYRFATDCLEKEPGVEVEKADVYEIYKSFSRAEGHGVRHDNVFWREFRRVFHFEETRHRDENGDPGPRLLADARLTEKALKYAPDHLREKYSDMVEGGPEEASDGDDTPGLNDLNPGRHTIEATIAETLEPKPWLQAEGTLVDDGDLLDYVARGDGNPMADVDEGDRVRITNAKAETNRDGVTQLEVTGVCDVVVLEVPEPGQTSIDAGGNADQSAEADGGTTTDTAEADSDDRPEPDDQLEARVLELLRTEYGPRATVTVANLAGGLGEDPDAVREVLDRLAERKGILEPTEEGYRRLG